MASSPGDRGYDSSPDPLAMSADESTTRLTRRAAGQTPLTKKSPSKQNRTMNISELGLESPAKSMVLNTPRATGASPWRIKVTVQAEPGSDEENTMSPSVKRVTRTKTTTVPLKDPDSHSPVKRPRGRPRKSDTSVGDKPKPNGAPHKNIRSNSRGSGAGAVALNAADVDTDIPLKKRRGRPRKSIQPPVEDQETPISPDMISEDGMAADFTSGPAAWPETTSSRRKIRFASPSVSSARGETTDTREQAQESVDATPRKKSSGKLCARKGTPHAKKITLLAATNNSCSEEGCDVFTPSSEEEDPEPQVLNDDETLDDQGVVTSVQVFEDEETHNIDNYAFDEGTTRMPDDTTVLDSENFSMISVDSLPGNGGFSSSSKPEGTQGSAIYSIRSLLHTTPETSVTAPPQVFIQPGSLHSSTTSNSAQRLLSIESTRYTTPVLLENEEPLAPPAIQPASSAITKAETPQLGRVVTAGVALQGLVDPNRTTPDPSQKALNEKPDRLDDLFRGFSEGTRKELQAGLRLGEQLADSQSKLPSPEVSSPIKPPKEGIFRTQRKNRSRLLTPEEQDHVVETVKQSTTEDHVQYPSLEVDDASNSLISPASSENEMSWRMDTPPVKPVDVVDSGDQKQVHDAKVAALRTQQPDFADIWQEEASRSSNSPGEDVRSAQASSHEQDLFTDVATSIASRGKPARIRRHKVSNQCPNNDRPASSSPLTPLLAEPVGSESIETGVTKATLAKAIAEQHNGDSDDTNEDSDDTGIFFQPNMPCVFQMQQPYERRHRTSDKVSLSLLLDQNESLLPESSPPVETKKGSDATNRNPFIATPPRFPGYPCSPSKSSPLRREIRGSDISSDPAQSIQEESSLPLIQSSPFRTIVDGESMLSTASDQRQFRAEMESVTDSSIVRVRNEANGYIDAYEPQERSLNDITEITEPSRTWCGESASTAARPRPNPAQHRQQSSTQKPTPTFSNHKATVFTPTVTVEVDQASTESSGHEDTEASSNPEGHKIADDIINSSTQQQEDSARHSLNPLNSVSKSLSPAAHPILSRHIALPKIEPWTKTHYKTLDKLYSTHLKHPALFLPSLNPPTPLSNTNEHLLQNFLATNKYPYVGAIFSAWGYSMVMTESLVVLCAVFMELLCLENIEQYEVQTRIGIEMGECAPGRMGDLIKGEEVARRLATVVLGEDVRRDEKKGLRIDRSKTLTISWPQ